MDSLTNKERVREALADAAKRLRSLAQDDRLHCRCVAMSGYAHSCEPCRALAASERYEQLLVETKHEL